MNMEQAHGLCTHFDLLYFDFSEISDRRFLSICANEQLRHHRHLFHSDLSGIAG